jgi:hypothetical protein
LTVLYLASLVVKRFFFIGQPHRDRNPRGLDMMYVHPLVRESHGKAAPTGDQPMSAPSRRPEIRRRRTRSEKITHLRKRLTAAKTDADRDRITGKLHKLAIGSPGQPRLK